MNIFILECLQTIFLGICAIGVTALAIIFYIHETSIKNFKSLFEEKMDTMLKDKNLEDACIRQNEQDHLSEELEDMGYTVLPELKVMSVEEKEAFEAMTPEELKKDYEHLFPDYE